MKRVGYRIRSCLVFLCLTLQLSTLFGDLNSGLVAWYPFDGNASDISGNGKHGTVHGATLATDRHGQANKAYSFGQQEYISTTSQIKGINNGSQTISGWFYKLTGSGWNIFGSDSYSAGQFHLIVSGGGTQLTFGGSYFGGTNGDGPNSTNVFVPDGWNHVSVVGVGNSFSVFLSGQLVISNAIRKAWNNSNLNFGRQYATAAYGRYSGSIDDVRVYNRALSTAEVLALYNLEKPKISLTDANFQTAVNLWFSDETNATATYGHMSDWNTSTVTTMANAFKDRATFNEDISAWDVSNVKTMRYMFYKASLFNQPIGDWNVSSVTSMQDMFREASVFNQPIGNWDVSTVTTTQYMFHRASVFDQPLGDWNTSSVTNMSSMFYGAFSFNQPLGNWYTSAVINMNSLFRDAKKFNQEIGEWDTSSVTNTAGMFLNAKAFNQSIENWEVNRVLDMSHMFQGASNFNQPIGDWNMSSVRQIRSMFIWASSFNQSLKSWDTSKITWMRETFEGAHSFNQDISDWNISAVNDMSNMFKNASGISSLNKGLVHKAFVSNPNWSYDWRSHVIIDNPNFQTAVNLWFDNQAEANATYGHISDWNVSAVTSMYAAFKDRTLFNEDISAWDVSNVRNMERMFNHASCFDQDIGDWNVSSVTNMHDMFKGAQKFNHSLAQWDTSSVTRMSYMFTDSNFNQPIGDWNTSAVVKMTGMFRNTQKFDQDISSWDVSSVSKLNQIFMYAKAFDQNISDWNVSSVDSFEDAFLNTVSLSVSNKGKINKSFSTNPNWSYDWRNFVLIDDSNFYGVVNLWFDKQAEANATYGHISDWNVSAVTNMSEAFKGRTEFDEDISGWDVSSVTEMRCIFKDAQAFNQPIGNWDVSGVIAFTGMFAGAHTFNQDISDWNTSSVTRTWSMFHNAHAFNQDIGAWDTSFVTDMNGTFKGAIAFDQDISDWNVSVVTNFAESFANADSLTDSNKGLIHESFLSNPNWPYDWSEFVPDINQTDTPTDHNQTQPGSPDNNETAKKPHSQDNNQTAPSPGDHNVTEPPIVDGNQTIIPSTNDSNQTTIDHPKPELIVLAPMVTTYGHQRDKNGTITLHGKIRSDGNGTIEQTGFNIRTSMDENDTVLLIENLSEDDSFSITFSSRDSFYFQAFARNEKGETVGVWKRVGATIQSYPIDGVVETGDGWSNSEWFGDFRYFENGWAYHYVLGWVYLSSDGADGIWLWRKEHGWLWSNQATWPFLWNHASGDWIYLLIREQQNPVFFDYSTGQYRR